MPYSSAYGARIVLLGDSITQMSFSSGGFGAHLSDVYQRRADVFNRGFSGYNTLWILELLQTEEGRREIFGPPDDSKTDIPSGAVRLVTIFLGANDASDSKLNARQHISVRDYRANLKKIVQIARTSCPHAKFIMVGPPPIHHEARLKYQVDRYGKEKASGLLERTLSLSGEYSKACGEVASEMKLPFFDVWKEMQEASPEPKWHEYLSDGLHLSRSGNEFVGKRLEKIIAEKVPEISVTPCKETGLYGNSSSKCDDIPHAGPWHDAITDPDNYQSLFSPKKQKTCGA
eukprot:CAMPEP_0194327738 /NCGR_PEP_ID=MMETSP0171-20130528/42265_1 /TAXON_ID=218684 /ORGANISM="Corethron pennatum, Strain L29A3" /LENGTH=287 /DNA_ID=CAMNT_0039087779 /DNA_START=105 /DNA_END=964 /DNA_ORIENTATION=+